MCSKETKLNNKPKIEECPRCENEEIAEGSNFCKICGLDLRDIEQ